MKFLKKIGSKLKNFCKDNPLLLSFVAISVINAFLLRVFTVKFAYNQIKPLLADIAAMLLMGAFSFCFKTLKGRFRYLMTMNVINLIFVAGNSIYYSNFKSFLSFSLLSTGSQLPGVMDAVVKNIMEAKDLIYLWSIPALAVVYHFCKKKTREYESQTKQKQKRSRSFGFTAVCGLVLLGIFAATLTGTDYSRLRKQWNREYVLGTFGMYVYQTSDAISSAYSRINMVFGYAEKKEAFDEFYDEKEENSAENAAGAKNEYTDIFKGKNVIVIHAESIQQFCMDTYINGEELTPNLNKLAKEGLYFKNFYAQESVGTSSDSEFTFSSSLMPASSGTVAINYWDRDYATTQKMLKNMGYYTFSMHGNNGSYWNRLNLHSSLGYDKFYNYTDDFVIDETIGLGLSDKSFFRQAVPKVKEIDVEHDNWYGCFIMLTNHTPFTDIERVSDYDISFRYKMYNEDTGLYEDISAPFLEGTKLGSYFKSVHYADEALGQFLADMDKEGLLENSIIVLYGDHDAKVKATEYEYYLNYDPFNETVLTEEDAGYIPVDDFYYNINRNTPFIIWSKGGEYKPKQIDQVMGMYDIQPTLGNMLGFDNKYALGHDIFSIPEDEENVVIFPNGNFITDTIYYDSQKAMYFDLEDYKNVMTHASCNQVYKDTPNPIFDPLKHGLFKVSSDDDYCADTCESRINDGIVDDEYIQSYAGYAEEIIDISNAIIYYDMITKTEQGFEQSVEAQFDSDSRTELFTPPEVGKRRTGIPM
ncbi:LTA synthase family protein [Ruminococcus albus]|uniref:Phosphoglycerol transferase MdoB n=1 Tax=Ruminococcus albus TaxID=1264 RepID=A0A1I1MET6_RUMAL|nr:LTA synthase family protein [Ruminococcus albus]SFC83889.1 Phosphoglycerol transferase MdoB [Ruminococcus albus]